MAPRRCGMTMAELLVTAGLMAIVMLGALEFLIAGVRYYRNADMSLDVQRDTLVAMSWFTRDVGETNANSFFYDNDPPGPVGLMVASPRNSAGQLVFGKTGRIVWNSIIGYTWDQTKATVSRTQFYLTNTSSPSYFGVPPTVGPTAGSDTPPGFQATLTDFATENPGLVTGTGVPPVETRIVARNVRQLAFTPTGGTIAITMTCGAMDSMIAGRNAYEVTVNTTVFCKN